MKITVNEITKKKTEIEIEFPLYRQHDVSGDNGTSIIYSKTTQTPTGHFREVEFHKHDYWNGEVVWELKKRHYSKDQFDTQSGINYILGNNEFFLGQKGWDTLVEEFKQFTQEALG